LRSFLDWLWHRNTSYDQAMYSDAGKNSPEEGPFRARCGTGSGILSIVAAKLGARQVCGIDHDELSVEIARENVERIVYPILSKYAEEQSERFEEI